MYFWLTHPQGKKGLKTTSAGSQGYVLDRSVASPLSCPAVFCPLTARRFQSKGKEFQLVWYTYPIRKMCCLHCMGCSVIITAGGIGHDWAALAEMGVGWHWNTKVTWKSEVADFGVWQILIPNTFAKEVCHYSIGAINTQGKFVVSEIAQFLVE